MKIIEYKGFNQNGEKIEGFTAKCEKCGSNNIEVQYEFNYYGGMTGWDSSLAVQCNDCESRANLST
jgi:hypothetical protein